MRTGTLKRVSYASMFLFCLISLAGCAAADLFVDEDGDATAFVQGRSRSDQSPARCQTLVNTASDKRYYLSVNLSIEGCAYVDCLDILVFSIDGLTCSDHEIWTNRNRTIKLFQDAVSEGPHKIRFDYRYSGTGCSSRPEDQGRYEFIVDLKQDSLVSITDRINCGSPAMIRHTLTMQ